MKTKNLPKWIPSIQKAAILGASLAATITLVICIVFNCVAHKQNGDWDFSSLLRGIVALPFVVLFGGGIEVSEFMACMICIITNAVYGAVLFVLLQLVLRFLFNLFRGESNVN
jgi:hypothetical protein